MIRRFAIPTTLALLLGACASYDSGYYAPGHAGYGDYYYDNPQVIVDEHYPYWGGYYGFGFFGPGYGLGYFPGDCFGFPYGYAPGFCDGFYDPWWYVGYYHRHHHGHNHDPRDNVLAGADVMHHVAAQFSDRNGVFGTPTMRPPGHPSVLGDARMQRVNPTTQRPWEPRRESREDSPRHHRDANGGNR